MVIKVSAIRRYPVKGLGFEALACATLEKGEGIAGDRQYALARPEHAEPALSARWLQKRAFMTPDRHPALACVEIQRDEDGAALKLYQHGKLLGSGNPENESGRRALEQAIAALFATPDLPRLVGQTHSRFTDAQQGLLSIVCLPSLDELSRSLGLTVDVRRFRANIILTGGLPWQELDWTHEVLRIGETRLRIVEPIVRCSATSANPVSGEADINLLRPLARLVDEPVFGVYAEVINGGEITSGDEVGVPSGAGRFPDRSCGL